MKMKARAQKQRIANSSSRLLSAKEERQKKQLPGIGALCVPCCKPLPALHGHLKALKCFFKLGKRLGQ